MSLMTDSSTHYFQEKIPVGPRETPAAMAGNWWTGGGATSGAPPTTHSTRGREARGGQAEGKSVAARSLATTGQKFFIGSNFKTKHTEPLTQEMPSALYWEVVRSAIIFVWPFCWLLLMNDDSWYCAHDNHRQGSDWGLEVGRRGRASLRWVRSLEIMPAKDYGWPVLLLVKHFEVSWFWERKIRILSGRLTMYSIIGQVNL